MPLAGCEGNKEGFGRTSAAVEFQCAWPGRHIKHTILHGDACDRERRPMRRQTRLKAETVRLRRESHKTVEHHLRQQDGLQKLAIQAKAAASSANRSRWYTGGVRSETTTGS